MTVFNLEKAQKFNNKDNYFDVNYIWAYPYRYITRWLYGTPVLPEHVLFASLVCGTVSAYFYLISNDFQTLILAVLFIQLKNILDTVDGSLARAKGLDSRIGRFLDSLADAFIYILVFAAISHNLYHSSGEYQYIFLGTLGLFSVFIQCSYFHYYQVAYLDQLSQKRTNRTDESFASQDRQFAEEKYEKSLLAVLQRIYSWVYGWQDKMITFIDTASVKLILKERYYNENKRILFLNSWYSHKGFLAANAFLCFGTQILILSIFTLLNELETFLWVMIIAGNLYMVALIVIRSNTFLKRRS